MDSTSVFSLVTMVVSVIKPPIITLLDHLWISKAIKEQEPKKAAIFLLTIVLGAIMAQVINLVGGFGLSILDCLIVGTPSAFAGGQVGHRTLKFVKNGKTNGKTESGKP